MSENERSTCHAVHAREQKDALPLPPPAAPQARTSCSPLRVAEALRLSQCPGLFGKVGKRSTQMARVLVARALAVVLVRCGCCGRRPP